MAMEAVGGCSYSDIRWGRWEILGKHSAWVPAQLSQHMCRGVLEKIDWSELELRREDYRIFLSPSQQYFPHAEETSDRKKKMKLDKI